MTRFALRGLFGRKLRTALTAIAVVLGVAMISGTYVLTDSITSAFDSIFSETYRGTDAAITGKSAFDLGDSGGSELPSFDESLLPEVKDLPEVGAAIGGVQGAAHLIGKNGKAIVFGGAPNIGFSVDPAQPQFNSLELVDGDWPGQGGVVIDKATADRKDFKVGDTIGIQSEGPVRTYRITGIVKFTGDLATIGGATLAGFDLASAQLLFGKVGKLDAIRIASKPGVPEVKLLASVRSILPEGTQVRSGTEQASEDASDVNSFISFLQTFLLAFAGVALFVGAFVIANSLSITIAQRMREFATLRTLGASRKQVLGSVIVESLVIGVLASVTGLFLGLFLAKVLFKLFDLVGFTLPNSGLALPDADDRRLAAGRDPDHAAREPPARAARDTGAADRGRPRGRDASRRSRSPASGRSGRSRSPCSGSPRSLIGLFVASRHRAGADRDGRRHAADLPWHRRLRRAARAAARRAARVARHQDRRRGRCARQGQRTPQPAAHRLDGVGADDRPRARHPSSRCSRRGSSPPSAAPSTRCSPPTTRSRHRTTSTPIPTIAAEAAAKAPGVEAIASTRTGDARIFSSTSWSRPSTPDRPGDHARRGRRARRRSSASSAPTARSSTTASPTITTSASARR